MTFLLLKSFSQLQSGQLMKFKKSWRVRTKFGGYTSKDIVAGEIAVFVSGKWSINRLDILIFHRDNVWLTWIAPEELDSDIFIF